MTVPTLDVRVNFDRLGISRLANDGFETDTTGWSVAAGIQGAATSITRTAAAPYMGTYVGRLVTTGTSGSGVKFVMASTFTSGHTYRFRVYLKSISGTTSALIRIGSLGTAGDRATATMTLTTSWVAYTVDFTPTGNRTDIQINVTNNTASIMTADIDLAEVYDLADDVTGDIDALSTTTGANFEGGVASGQATLTFRNDTNQWTDGSYNLQLGLNAYIRATVAGATSGLFYGTVARVTPDIASRTIAITCDDPVAAWAIAAEVGIAASTTTSISAFRGLVLDALGEPAARRSLSTSDYETAIPVTGADHADPLGLLASLDRSTGTLGFLVFDPSPSVLFRYTTKTDLDLLTQAVTVTLADTFTGATADFLPQDIVTMQRVDYSLIVTDPVATVWTSDEIPIALAAGESRTVWASFTDSVTGPALVSTSTGSPTITPTWFDRSAKIVITAGAAALVTALSATGSLQRQVPTSATYTGSSSLGTFVTSPIDATYVMSPPVASGLAQRTVERHDGSQPRLSVTHGEYYTFGPLGASATIALGRVRASGYTGVIGRIDLSVTAGVWETTFGIEPRSVATDLFTLDSDALDGAAVMAP